MTREEYVQAMVDRAGPITDETAAAAARILVGVEPDRVAA